MSDDFGRVSLSLEALNGDRNGLADAVGASAQSLVTLNAATVDSLLQSPAKARAIGAHNIKLGPAGTVRTVLRGSVATGFNVVVNHSGATDLLPVSQLACRPVTPVRGKAVRGPRYFAFLIAEPDQTVQVRLNHKPTAARLVYRDPLLRESWYVVSSRNTSGTVDIRITGGRLQVPLDVPTQPAQSFFGVETAD